MIEHGPFTMYCTLWATENAISFSTLTFMFHDQFCTILIASETEMNTLERVTKCI